MTQVATQKELHPPAERRRNRIAAPESVVETCRKDGGLHAAGAREVAAGSEACATNGPAVRQTRYGVIGLGYWGPNLVRNFNSAVGQSLCACADLNSARTQVIARNYPDLKITNDPEQVLADSSIDAVAIATPVHSHYPLVKAALEAGKHVLVEKPFTSSVEHAEELIELADREGRILMVDHTFLYSPTVRKIKEIVDSGQLGEFLYIDSVRINLGLFQQDVNVVWDLAPHDLSIVDYLVGRLPRSLSAFGAAHAGNGIESVAYLNLDFGDGLIANFHVNWLSPVKIRHTMLGGTKKTLVYNDLDPIEKIKVYDSGINVRQDDFEGRRRLQIDYRTGDVWSPHVANQEPLGTMVSHFIECVEKGRTPMTDGRAGLRIVRILDAAQRSIKAQGGRITL
jgi:predicted dehydrogenase